jgi:hypothetical protein
MSRNFDPEVRRAAMLTKVAALVTLGVVLSWAGAGTWGQEARSGPATIATAAAAGSPDALEDAFWLCDYVGSTRSVDTGTAIACSTITGELQTKRFAGDFHAMLAWWRANKPARHEALEAASRAGLEIRAASLAQR